MVRWNQVCHGDLLLVRKDWEGVSEPVHHYASWTGVSTEEFPLFEFYVSITHTIFYRMQLVQMNQDEVFGNRKEAP